MKPTKFLLSIGVHALTLSWASSLVRPDRREAFPPLLTVWAVLVSSIWELLCIGSQAARGRMSHSNNAPRYDPLVFASMGVPATALVAANLPLAWETAVRPRAGRDAAMAVATAAGLVLSRLLGRATGIMMGARPPRGRQPRDGEAARGRLEHVLGPPAGAALARHPCSPTLPLPAIFAPSSPAGHLFFLLAVETSYVLLIAGTFVQALAGLPLVPPGLLPR